MNTIEASHKFCPFQAGRPEGTGLCDNDNCMAWQTISATDGFCALMSRSRSITATTPIAVMIPDGLTAAV